MEAVANIRIRIALLEPRSAPAIYPQANRKGTQVFANRF